MQDVVWLFRETCRERRWPALQCRVNCVAAHSNKVLRQVKEHRDAALDLIDSYLAGLVASSHNRVTCYKYSLCCVSSLCLSVSLSVCHTLDFCVLNISSDFSCPTVIGCKSQDKSQSIPIGSHQTGTYSRLRCYFHRETFAIFDLVISDYML